MIRENLHTLLEQLPATTRLVAVSKYRPLEDLQAAYDAGQRIFAESRPLEFSGKAASLPGDIEWHFIGHLQTNKLKYVVGRAALIHSVDSIRLLDAIEAYCTRNGIVQGILVEVHIGAEQTKQGFTPEEAEKLFGDMDALCSRYPHIRFRGLMGMASHTDDTERIEKDFILIKDLFDRISSAHPGHDVFSELSIGMSADWKIAIRHGATMVRIGSAIFG